MDGAVRERLMTVEEFLDWHPDDEKWELVGGIPIRMMSESNLHDTVKSGIGAAIGRRLRPPGPCRPGIDGRQVFIDDFTSYRPDAYIDCAPFGGPGDLTVEKPTVVFEVSISSLDRDLVEKRANYFHNPHVEHVVVVDANARRVHHFRRDDREERVLEVADTLELSGTVMLDLPVAEFFEWLP